MSVMGRSDVSAAANRHPGQVGYAAHPQKEVRDETPTLRARASPQGQDSVSPAPARSEDLSQRPPDQPLLWHLSRPVLHLGPPLREAGDGRSAGPLPQTRDDSLPHPTRGHRADPAHPRGAPLRGGAHEPLSPTPLPGLRLADNDPEDLPPSSGRPRLAQALPSGAQASSRRPAPRSRPIGSSRCELHPPRRASSPALLPVPRH